MNRALDIRRVAVTSVVRYARPSEISGYLRIVDLERGRVTFLIPVPESGWRFDDPNPRGGTRGTRGISVYGDRLALVNAERLFVFDTSWRLVADSTNRLMSEVHDILADERGIWVTATGCDTLLLFDWEGRLRNWVTFREDKHLMEELGFDFESLRPMEPDLDYRDPQAAAGHYDALHLNGLGRSDDGMLLSFGQVVSPTPGARDTSALVRLRPTGWSILHRPGGVNVPNHNVAEEAARLIYNDSTRSCLVAWDQETETEVAAVTVPGDPPFARGLAHVGPDLWLVGSQWPLALHLVDLAAGMVVGSYDLGGVRDETVFALCPLPDEFSDPQDVDPAAFWRRATLGPGVTPIPV